MKRQIQGRRLVPLIIPLIALTVLTGCGSGVPAASWFGIAASDDTVYLAANEQVYSIDLEQGARLWAFPVEPNQEVGPFYATPLLKEDLAFVGSFGDGRLFALSQGAGTQTGGAETGSPIVDGAASIDGGLVVGNNEGEVYVVDDQTGTKVLLLKADTAIWATPLVDAANGRVYVAATDHRLYAVDLERGETVWVFEAGGAFTGTPALGDGMLYLGALNSTFYALDAGTGDERWRFETEGWVWGGPLLDGDTVYFGDMDGKVRALDAADGSQRWTFEAQAGVRVTPVLVDDVLYFGDREGQVYAVGAGDGEQRWTLTLSGPIYSQPVVRGGYLLVSPHNAKVQLVALDVESGAERWAFPPREE